MDRKIGYTLLWTGVAMLVFSAAPVILILLGKMQAPQVFSSETLITITTSLGGGMNVPLPPQATTAANLCAFFAAIFLLSVIGAKLGRLGIELLRGLRAEKEAAAK